jgi:hypothetical protein
VLAIRTAFVRSINRAIVAGLAMLGAVALAAAADDGAQKMVSDVGGFWSIWGSPVKANFVAAPSLKGGAAQRVTISPKPARPWDVGTYAAISKPVKKGDVLVLMFWARAEKPPAGSDLILVSAQIYEAGQSGHGVTPEANFIIGKQWKFYYVSGTAAKDYPTGTLSAGMVLGTGEQVIDFGPISVADYGPGFDINNLLRS